MAKRKGNREARKPKKLKEPKIETNSISALRARPAAGGSKK